MPTNPSLQTERFALVADLAATVATLGQLQQLAYEPSTKRYTRSRPAIREAWNSLGLHCARAANRFADAGLEAKRAAKRKAKPAPPVEPPAQEEVA